MSGVARIAHVAIWAIALVPTVVALALLGPDAWASAGAVVNALGRLTGVAGLGLMLAAAVVSCRVPGFDRPFGGLTRLWETHHRVAAAAFLLLLAHPLLLALGAAEAGLESAVATLVPPAARWPVWLGWAALLVLMAFLAPSFKFFGEPDYQRWKRMHRLAAPALLAGVVHMLWLARSLPPTLSAVLWLTLAALAVAAVGYRFLYARYRGRSRYRVADLAWPMNNVIELRLAPLGRPLRYEAGQFVYLTPYDRALEAGCGEEHPYTLSSAPQESTLRVAIKGLGDASRAMHNVAPGSEVGVEGPYGCFLEPDAGTRPALWIAGGIGITPFLGRARELATTGDAADVVLILCVQDEARALFAQELATLAAQIPGFALHLHYFYQRGPLDAAFLDEHCPDYAGRAFHVCGPPPLVSLVRTLGRRAGVPRQRIAPEAFNLL